MNDYCGTFTIFTDDGSIARVDIVKKVLYYVPFEDLTIDEIDSLNTKMRNAPEVMGLTGKYYKEVNPDDNDTLVPDPILATYIESLKALPDCNILVTIDSGNPSPSRDALINLCKRSRNTMVYYVSNDGKTAHVYDYRTGETRSVGYC